MFIKNTSCLLVRLFAPLILLAPLTNVNAAITDLSNAPLVNSTTGDVLPNLLYILDNSGSMTWDYMPDYVNDSNKCKTTGTTTGPAAFSATCGYSDPPYMTTQFNTIYYNPTITYTPAVEGNGVPKNSMTSANTSGWTQVPRDAYGKLSAALDSLVPNTPWDNTKGFADKAWCNKSSGVTTTDLQDPAVCKTNSQYIYPNNTGTQATSYNQAWTKRGYPYYYTVSVGEYCTTKDLTNCIDATAPSGAYTFPAYLRWCNDSARTNCQAKYTDAAYFYAKWSGVSTGTLATGKIKINAQSPANSPAASPTALSVTGVTVDGVSIIPASPAPALTITDTTNSSQRNTLASNIAAAINAHASTPEFTATASNDTVTVTAVVPGAYSGTIVVNTSTLTTTATPGAKATGSITFTRVGRTSTPTQTQTLNSLTVSSVNLFAGTGTCGSVTSLNQLDSTTTRNDFATQVADRINTCISSPRDYTATSSGSTVTITAVSEGTASNGGITGNPSSGGNLRYNTSSLAGGVDGVPSNTYTLPTTITNFTGGSSAVNTFQRVDIIPSVTSYPKATSRKDCAGATTCTYDEEMTNFANWYAYYHTRMQMMKTSTSLAFKSIDSRYRIGFITISNQSANYLPVAQFTATQKNNWYAKLFNTSGNSGTPLRSALSIAGRIFAGQGGSLGIGSSSDPVQYSCQQNFSLLTTDGYWNTDSASAVKDLSGNQVGNMDSATEPKEMYEGPVASSNSLADVAKYYYDTDLRTSALGNCTGGTRPNGTTGDVCENNVFVTPTDNNIKQHMTTFTLGLGVDGTLTYVSDYKTATSGDFYDLKQGALNWPVPQADKQTAVDDLWHAAVNGQGTYFSAKDPGQLSKSLTEALNSIAAKVGSGAAAATSTLKPVAGNNYSFVASYTSAKWTGNLEARGINVDTGGVGEDAVWCLENVAADTCAAPGILEVDQTNHQTYCKTPGADASTCLSPGILDGTTCKVDVATTCSGTLQNKFSTTSNSDTRTIYMNVGGALVNFDYGNVVAAGKNGNFDNAFLTANLPQASNDFDNLGNPMSTTKLALVNGTTLVNFLRGNTGYENRASNAPPLAATDNRIYRLREATLGDLVDSSPVYVGTTIFNYSDPNYGPESAAGTYKNIQKTRAGTVYIGSNDGMLHAIDSVTGEERWAYIPTMVLDNLWKIARKDYDANHSFYVNGDITSNDICVANCSSPGAIWKTILVAGLGGGGKGYFALDITDPNAPSLLWEFDIADDSDMGYSFGNPIITKKSDGTWVAVLTSGYNNTSGPNAGKGVLYVLNAYTGAIISKYVTDAGTSTTPSGLAKLNGYIADADINNSVLYFYGGDLLGNLWRFDINSPQIATSNPYKMAILKDNSGVPQPIMTQPELATISGKRVIYVGTGRYLGVNDLSDTQQQTIYAISDDPSAPGTLDSPRTNSSMVNQTLVNSSTSGTRSVQQPANTVNFASGRGWYIDFPDTGERQNKPAQLVFGTLLLPTVVPTNSLCSPGGYGWLNFLDYKTGASVAGNIVATKTNAPIVGINVVYVKGEPVVNIVTADNPTPTFPPVQPEFSGASESGFTNRRVIWRELINEE